MNAWTSLAGSALGILCWAGMAQASAPGSMTSFLLSQGLEDNAVAPSPSGQYQTYINDVFNFSVAVPQPMFASAAPMVGKMGQRFLSPSGSFELAVYGQHQGNWSIQQLYENTLFVYQQQGADITFSQLEDDRFTIAAIDPKGAVLYTKQLFHQDNLLTLGLVYDASLAAELEPVASYIAASFQPSAR